MPSSDPRARAVLRARKRVREVMDKHGLWSGEEPPRPRMEVMAGPDEDELPVERWLEWVYVPRTRLMAGGVFPFPEHSDAAGRYERESEAANPELLGALRELDAALNGE